MRTRILTASAAAVSTVAVVAVLAVPGSDAAGTTIVKVDDYNFSPTSVTVKRNTTVKWIWVGQASHDVEVVKGPKDFHSKVMKSGSYTKKFTKKGTYRIDCSIHSTVMKMVVKVK